MKIERATGKEGSRSVGKLIVVELCVGTVGSFSFSENFRSRSFQLLIFILYVFVNVLMFRCYDSSRDKLAQQRFGRVRCSRFFIKLVSRMSLWL